MTSDRDRIRFDRNALENHAEDYCKKEARLARELVESLREAAVCAPIEPAPRVRRLMNDADHLEKYFSDMGDALIESGQLVEQLSKTVLERLEDADAEMKTLLR
jgi:hypothetical protein